MEQDDIIEIPNDVLSEMLTNELARLEEIWNATNNNIATLRARIRYISDEASPEWVRASDKLDRVYKLSDELNGYMDFLASAIWSIELYERGEGYKEELPVLRRGEPNILCCWEVRVKFPFPPVERKMIDE